MVDVDGSGTIDLDELYGLFKFNKYKIPRKSFNKLFSGVPLGQMNFKEFKKLSKAEGEDAENFRIMIEHAKYNSQSKFFPKQFEYLLKHLQDSSIRQVLLNQISDPRKTEHPIEDCENFEKLFNLDRSDLSDFRTKQAEKLQILAKDKLNNKIHHVFDSNTIPTISTSDRFRLNNRSSTMSEDITDPCPAIVSGTGKTMETFLNQYSTQSKHLKDNMNKFRINRWNNRSMFEHYSSVEHPEKNSINKIILASGPKIITASDAAINPKNPFLSSSNINDIKECEGSPISIYNNYNEMIQRQKESHQKSVFITHENQVNKNDLTETQLKKINIKHKNMQKLNNSPMKLKIKHSLDSHMFDIK